MAKDTKKNKKKNKKIEDGAPLPQPKERSKRVKLEAADAMGGVLKLEKIHLLEAEMIVAKMEAAKEKHLRMNMEADKLEQAAIMKARNMRMDAKKIFQEKEQLTDQLKLFWNRMGEEETYKKHNIDFKKVTYDSDTGIITIHEDREPDEGRQN